MSVTQTLLKARQHVQSGQYDAAITLYRGLLRLTPKHPEVNNLLGALLIQIGRAEQAVAPLEVAFAAQPQNPEVWVRLLMAHHRGGDVQRARSLLARGHALGVDEERLAVYTRDLAAPAQEAVATVHRLIGEDNRVSAEIAARMLVTDYPDNQTAKACLDQVLGAGRAP